MAAALGSVYPFLVFCVTLISLALTQDETQFIYHGFKDSQLLLDGVSFIHKNGLLTLTNNSVVLREGHAFYPFPLKFNTSSSQSLSFSTNFVFVIVPSDSGGHGIAFVISPSMNFSEALQGPYLGIFSPLNNGRPANHILAIELDTVETTDFFDINDNHVGVDVNSLISNVSAPAAYFSDTEGINKSLQLTSGNPLQIWIDYSGPEKFLSVTLAPITIPKPKRPLLSAFIDLSQILLDTMYVGFSASTGGTYKSDHYILGWSFNRTGQAQNLNVSNLPSLDYLSPPPDGIMKLQVSPVIIIIVLLAIGLVLITIGAAVYIVRKKKYEEVYEDWEREYGPERISYKHLYKATGGFSDKEVIGKGGFGKVYRGVLPSNEQIAVKRVSHDSRQGMKEFVAEVVSMGRLRHRNLVKLRAYCRRRGEFLLVYDYMPNGSLDKILHGNLKPNLNWFQRFQIIRGVAIGLLYLHEEWEQVVLHRDIKPANVLLDAELNGKLGDFGLARLHDHGSSLQTTKLVGTFGYMAPELMRTGRASTSTDVYAFGVLMLEMACGRRPIEQEGSQETVSLVDWVTNWWRKGAILDASDPRLEGIFADRQMEVVLKLGLLCSQPNPVARPSMRQVTQYLDGQVELPDIPPEGFISSPSTEINEASDCEMSIGTRAAHTRYTTDSILRVGR